jgi:hypothetical protein
LSSLPLKTTALLCSQILTLCKIVLPLLTWNLVLVKQTSSLSSGNIMWSLLFYLFIWSLFKDAVSKSDYITLNDWMNWKRLCSKFGYYAGFRRDWGKPSKISAVCAGRNSNQTAPEHKWGTSLLQSTSLVLSWRILYFCWFETCLRATVCNIIQNMRHNKFHKGNVTKTK